jgi:hypothetical protein
MGLAQASRPISHGLPLEGHSDGWKVHLAQRFSIGEGVVMTGIGHLFHWLEPLTDYSSILPSSIWDVVRNHQFAMATPPPAWGSMSSAAATAGLLNLIAWAYSCTLPCCGSAQPGRTLHAIAAVLVSASCPCAFLGAPIAFELERCACALQR